MSAPTVPTSPGARSLAVVGVHAIYDRVGVLALARPAEPHPASELPDPVMIARSGTEAAGWVTSAVTAVRLAAMAARSLGYAPRVAVRRPVAGGTWAWEALICGALLLASVDPAELVQVGGRLLNAAIVQREAAADRASPPHPRDRLAHDEWRSRAWRRGYPAELLGPQKQAGRGVRLVLRLPWDVAGAAGLCLAEQGGAAA